MLPVEAMPNRSRKKPRDLNILAAAIVADATDQERATDDGMPERTLLPWNSVRGAASRVGQRERQSSRLSSAPTLHVRPHKLAGQVHPLIIRRSSGFFDGSEESLSSRSPSITVGTRPK